MVIMPPSWLAVLARATWLSLVLIPRLQAPFGSQRLPTLSNGRRGGHSGSPHWLGAGRFQLRRSQLQIQRPCESRMRSKGFVRNLFLVPAKKCTCTRTVIIQSQGIMLTPIQLVLIFVHKIIGVEEDNTPCTRTNPECRILD